MQWHWGNIGSAIAGASALAIAVGALIRSPGALRDWRARQRAQADAAHEEAETIRLERHRGLSGWSAQGINTYGVTLVTDPGELGRATSEACSGHPTPYVVLRVTGTDTGSINQAETLRQTIKAEGYISRPPTTGEREALETGLDAMGIPHAGHGRTRP